ncbi:putative multicopper oxidase, type 1 [Hortaea werneckii]|nr:putative multicopper oxidase, type 1 [Hortaea werneckii]KAI7593505.1 putative multicopper oxidase, type 1 [Hortaea werneckii]
MILAVGVTVGSVIGFGHSAQDRVDQTDETSRVYTSDYIFDQGWDYHAPPQRREYHWTVRDHEHNPDGIYRRMILVNDQFPGPQIRVNEGDTIVVRVHNMGVNATSIHWHGLYQNGTPHMDGTVGITQCPIPPGGKFTYEFTVRDQSGTYWWHGHNGMQASDGMYGPLIVHGRNEDELQRIKYDTDRVVMLSDHYHDLSSALLWQYLKPDMENAEPIPQSGLINGRGLRNCDDFPDRKCDNTTSNAGYANFGLAVGKAHRLRILNVGAFAEFQFQIDEHELAVTEVDGTDVEPVSYHRLNINPAQRYSVVINTDVQTSDSFWMRARMITQCFTDPPKTLQPDVMGIVQYVSNDSSTADHGHVPSSTDWTERLNMECKDMNTTELQPASIKPAPADADAFFYLRSNFEIGAYRLSRGFFNSSTWRPNVRSPTLLRAIDGAKEANHNFTSTAVSEPASPNAFINNAAFDEQREYVLQTTGVQTIDILISNFDDGNHPIHLHGYKYFVLAQGHGYPAMESKTAGMTRDNLEPLYASLDLTNPLRRDTASVEGFGWLLLRVMADNPGAWAFHCHLSWHTEAGLLMQLLTRTDELGRIEVPESNRELCAMEGIEKGMGPADEDYRDLAK